MKNNVKTPDKKDLPTGKFQRTKTVASVATKIGAKKIAQVTKSVFKDENTKKKIKADFNKESAKMLFDALVTLRGSALKAAQLLSLEADLLPEEYRRELAKSCYRVPPLNRALARKMITSGLGKPPEELFAEFEYDAFAAASLGQVHKARLHSGVEVAVKLQYPGVKQSMGNDFGLLRGLLTVHPHSKQMMILLDEIEARLLEETDYNAEAENLAKFRTWLKPFGPGIVVPEVYPSLCSSGTLTAEFLSGRHVDEWLTTEHSQKERDWAAQSIFNAQMYLFYEKYCIHADSNPGNYIFCDNGNIGILDFGCIKQFSKEFNGQYKRFLKALLQNKSKSEILDCYFDFGFFPKTVSRAEVDRVYDSILIPYNEWTIFPYKSRFFKFRENAQYMKDGRDLFSLIVNYKTKTNGANPHFLFLGRTWFGLYRIFEKMDAKVSFENQWECG